MALTTTTSSSNTNNESLVVQIQSELDAIKENISDLAYKTLCDKLMDINKTENKGRIFYEFTVCVPRIVPDGSDERSFELTMEPEKRIRTMVRYEGEMWMREINEHGFKEVANRFFSQQVRNKDELHVHDMCEECEEVSHINIEVSYPTLIVIAMKPADV
tara:strand:+ start:126 stop:605 length:480 start_codon:yes stop_codon:yes gene_type:complete